MLRSLVQRGIFAILLVMVSWAQAGEPPLKSESFLVADARSLERIALRGDPAEPMPIASITKLMTAMVVLESRLPLDETITVGQEDIDTLKDAFAPAGRHPPHPARGAPSGAHGFRKPGGHGPVAPLSRRAAGLFAGDERQGPHAGNAQFPFR